MDGPADGFRLILDEGVINDALRDYELALRRGQLVLGPFTERFETHLAELAGTRFAVAVSSGTMALEAMLSCASLADSEVLIPTNTNVATAAAVIRAGAKPVLYDNDVDPDVDDVFHAVSDRTRAIIVVHIGGYISSLVPEVAARCNELGLDLFEDAAHAHGARHGLSTAGALGRAGAFSFFPTKIITTGEGGAITTNDAALSERIACFRNQGKDLAGVHVMLGASARISEPGAALGLAQLIRLGERHQRLRRIAERYMRALDGLDWCRFPWENLGGRPSGHKIILALDPTVDADRLRLHLVSRGVHLAGSVYAVPLHRQPVFGYLTDRAFPRADRFAACHVCLPFYDGLSDDRVEAVVAGMLEFHP